MGASTHPSKPTVAELVAGVEGLSLEEIINFVDALHIKTAQQLFEALTMKGRIVRQLNAFRDYIQDSLGKELTKEKAIELLMGFHHKSSRENILSYFSNLHKNDISKVVFEYNRKQNYANDTGLGSQMMMRVYVDGVPHSCEIDTTTGNITQFAS